MDAKKEKMIIVCAPSGTGKTTIVKAILPYFPQISFSVSATSRPPRKGEQNGTDYYFLSPLEFEKKIANDEFIEWEEVYPGSYYGTLRSELNRIWKKNQQVIFDVDVLGGINIKKQYPENSLALFFMPPSLEILRKRLEGRATETPESLKKRLDRAGYEMGFSNQFDRTIINNELNRAIEETKTVISNFLNNGQK
jgi:guanylate kinase